VDLGPDQIEIGLLASENRDQGIVRLHHGAQFFMKKQAN
jgi:hypothetical protein